MAEAPGGEDESSPRKTTTYNRFEGMNSQKSRYGVPDNEMFWLENIMRVAPKKLHSVPGPTGNLATFPIITPGCPETTVPTGTQNLSSVHCYNYNTGNESSQLNFVGGNPATGSESFVVSSATNSGVGIPYSTAGTNPNMKQATGETLNPISVLPLTGGPISGTFYGQSAQAGSSGHSDELSILFHMTDLTPQFMGQGSAKVYFNYSSGAVTYLLYQAGSVTGAWAKRGTRFWDIAGQASGHTLERYDMTTGGNPVFYADMGLSDNLNILSLSATDNFLYMLYTTGASTCTIYKLNLDTMAEVAHWDLTGTFGGSRQMAVASDDLLYLIAGGWSFGYFQPSTGTATLIDTVPDDSACISTLTPSAVTGQTSFQYNKGYFYMGYGGFGTGSTNVVKVGPLVCPGTDIPIGT